MVIDVAIVIIVLLTFFHGFKKGLISSVLSLISIVIALVAAIKLSQVASLYLTDWFNIGSKYLPIIAFVLVFILVVGIVNFASRAIEGVFKTLQLNFINKTGGGLMWAVSLLSFWFNCSQTNGNRR